MRPSVASPPLARPGAAAALRVLLLLGAFAFAAVASSAPPSAPSSSRPSSSSSSSSVNRSPSSPSAFSAPPILGLGAVLLKPRVKIVRGGDWDGGEKGGDALARAGEFFVDSFWTGKVGGGASTLSKSQASSLERQQVAEFKRRYYRPPSRAVNGKNRMPGGLRSPSAMDKRAELLMLVDARGEIAGCAGVEVEKIKKMDGMDSTFSAPLMSNLAVSRRYRRRGLAEDLVRAAEEVARKEWGYDECYLYVEGRNAPAVKLYSKLGYRKVWEDGAATTLLPTEDGKVINGKTTILCMKKRLGGGVFGNLFGR